MAGRGGDPRLSGSGGGGAMTAAQLERLQEHLQRLRLFKGRDRASKPSSRRPPARSSPTPTSSTRSSPRRWPGVGVDELALRRVLDEVAQEYARFCMRPRRVPLRPEHWRLAGGVFIGRNDSLRRGLIAENSPDPRHGGGRRATWGGARAGGPDPRRDVRRTHGRVRELSVNRRQPAPTPANRTV